MDNKRNYKFPYGIEYVVSLDLPEAPHYKAARGFNTDCPFCGRKRKLNIDTEKNVYNCPACGQGGGMLALHAALNNNTTKWAKHDLDNKYKDLSEEEKENISNTVSISDTVSSKKEAYGLQMRSKIYHEYLKRLPLSVEFYNELKSERRGCLTDEQIKKLGYKTYHQGMINSLRFGLVNYAEIAVCNGLGVTPQNPKDLPEIVAELFARVGSRVPGFFVTVSKSTGKKHVDAYNPGEGVSFIPVRSRHGEISYFQTKYPALPENATQEQKDAYKKYGRYGSFGPTGCDTAGLESIHYTGFDYSSENTPETVWLTEGVLKADIAAILSNKPFISLVGISVYSQLADELKYLKKHGTKRINVATDMDYRDKEEVKNSMEKICEIVKKAGLECYLVTWDEKYKGIDDLLIASKKDHTLMMRFTKR